MMLYAPALYVGSQVASPGSSMPSGNIGICMNMCSVKRLVVSAVNFSEGGPLTVLRSFLREASESLPAEWEIIALVHNRAMFDVPRVKLVEFPDSKRSWLRRLYYEFWYFNRLSKSLRPDVWLSLHDITPRVVASRRVVYCHNPSPFFAAGLRELRQDPRFFLFSKFYRYLYRLNIHANDLVVVQQDWIRAEFQRMYGVPHVAVAYPVEGGEKDVASSSAHASRGVFLYPALPRTFKNFEVLCEAAKILSEEAGPTFELRITISGAENAYAASLRDRYSRYPAVKFIGRQSAAEMQQQYREAEFIVFPSLLETWGLPISEAKHWCKPLILADLPYAHEALGSYDRAVFFDPRKPIELAALMRRALCGEAIFDGHAEREVSAPFARDWKSLVPLIIGQ